MVTKTAALLLAAVSIYSPVCFACGMSHYHRTNGNTACHSGGYWSGTQCMTNTVWYTADSNHARQPLRNAWTTAAPPARSTARDIGARGPAAACRVAAVPSRGPTTSRGSRRARGRHARRPTSGSSRRRATRPRAGHRHRRIRLTVRLLTFRLELIECHRASNDCHEP